MITANQRYKESKSDLPFKEWLKNEQTSGKLADHETMFNANGEVEEFEEEFEEVMPITTIKKGKKSMMGINVLGVVGVGMLVYGLSQLSTNNE